MRDRVVQASLKLALEPILEADSRSPDRLAENVAAGDVELTKEDLDRVNETPRTARTAAATRRR
jgi:diketogulonate reductase-like aldo/keto reductase